MFEYVEDGAEIIGTIVLSPVLLICFILGWVADKIRG